MPVSDGQLTFERAHLQGKLAVRAPGDQHRLLGASGLRVHPAFRVRPGPVEAWERDRTLP